MTELYVELEEYGGGEIKLTEVLGGYSANYAIGGNVIYKIKKNLVEWRLSKNKLKTANEILCLKNIGQEDICQIVKELLDLPDEKLIRALFKLVDGNEPIKLALHKLYFVLQDLTEAVLSIAVNGKVNTDLLNLNEIIDNVSPEVANIIKNANYKHKGYCPLEPVTRIINLVEFPLDKIAEELNIKLFIPFNALELLNIKLQPGGYVLRPSVHSSSSKIDECLDTLIHLYKNSIDLLINYENNTIQLAKNISNFSRYIQKIIVDLVKSR
jgi:hypothetical protein